MDGLKPDPRSTATDVQKIEATWTSDLSPQVQSLRDEVQAIQIQLAEKRKPWYRQHSLLISIVALVFTVGFNLYGVLYQRSNATKEAVSKNVENLQTILGQLVEIRSDDAKDAVTAKADMAGYSTRNMLRNTKRLALLDAASIAIIGAKNRVPPTAYVALGGEAITDGQYAKGDEYLKLAVNAATADTTERMWALYARAQVRLTPDSPLYNPEEGRNFYHKALQERLPSNDFTRFQRGQLLGRIAQLEKLNNPIDAENYFRQAETEAKNMNLLNPLSQALIQVLTAYRQAISPAARGVVFADPKTWIGEWKLKYPQNLAHKGDITFIANQNFYGGYVDIFENGRLVEKAMGQVTLLDDKTLRLDWTGQRIVPAPAQTAGYSILKAKQETRVMSGRQYSFGEEAIRVQISR
jgi:hypothetical protein